MTRQVASAVLASCLLTARIEAAGCGAPIPIAHPHLSASGGAFVIEEMSGRPLGPPLRFWAYRAFSSANNGSQGQYAPGNEWLVGGVSHAASPEWFFLFQASWTGPAVAGCVKDATPEGAQVRTVVEISYLFEEGSKGHYTGYLIASVAAAGGLNFDFDRVADGNGGGPAFVKMVPIPVPRPVGNATENARDSAYMDVTLQLPEARSYGDPGSPNLIKGYEILYKNDDEPTTSALGEYTQVRNPQAPGGTLGLIPHGTTVATVSVPKPKSASYFVTVLIYDDPVPLIARGTSGHSAGVAAPGSAEPNKDEAKATPTPEPTSDGAGDAAAEAETSPVPSASAGSGERVRPEAENGEVESGEVGDVAAPTGTPAAAEVAPAASTVVGTASTTTLPAGSRASRESRTVDRRGDNPPVGRDERAAGTEGDPVRPLVGAVAVDGGADRTVATGAAPGSAPGLDVGVTASAMMAGPGGTSAAGTVATVAGASPGENVVAMARAGSTGASELVRRGGATDTIAPRQLEGAEPPHAGVIATSPEETRDRTAAQERERSAAASRLPLWTFLDVLMASSLVLLGVLVWLGRRS